MHHGSTAVSSSTSSSSQRSSFSSSESPREEEQQHQQPMPKKKKKSPVVEHLHAHCPQQHQQQRQQPAQADVSAQTTAATTVTTVKEKSIKNNSSSLNDDDDTISADPHSQIIMYNNTAHCAKARIDVQQQQDHSVASPFSITTLAANAEPTTSSTMILFDGNDCSSAHRRRHGGGEDEGTIFNHNIDNNNNTISITLNAPPAALLLRPVPFLSLSSTQQNELLCNLHLSLVGFYTSARAWAPPSLQQQQHYRRNGGGGSNMGGGGGFPYPTVAGVGTYNIRGSDKRVEGPKVRGKKITSYPQPFLLQLPPVVPFGEQHQQQPTAAAAHFDWWMIDAAVSLFIIAAFALFSGGNKILWKFQFKVNPSFVAPMEEGEKAIFDYDHTIAGTLQATPVSIPPRCILVRNVCFYDDDDAKDEASFIDRGGEQQQQQEVARSSSSTSANASPPLPSMTPSPQQQPTTTVLNLGLCKSRPGGGSIRDPTALTSSSLHQIVHQLRLC